MAYASPWRVPAFRRLYAATAADQIGIQVGHLALPLVALGLGASPGQIGLLAALGTSAYLLIGLPSGVWVDRLGCVPVLVTAALARVVLLTAVPLAWWFGALTLPHLYAAVWLAGCATVFFDVASHSCLPAVVGRDALVRANAGVVGLYAVGSVAGRGMGGLLVEVLTAPVAVAAQAVSHLAAAISLTGIRDGTSRRTRPAPASRRLAAEMRDGLRHVLHSRELRSLALAAACANLGAQTVNTMVPVLFIRQLGLPAWLLGVYWVFCGTATFVGARLARPLAARWGCGWTLATAGLCVAPAALLAPLLSRPPLLCAAGIAGMALVSVKTGVDNVLGLSLRQGLTPDALLGRMNATFRFLLMGSVALGSALSGVIGEFAGVRAALWTGAVILVLAALPLYFSPVRARRHLPGAPVPEPDPVA
ncbi:MFS transporter [Streptomyces sp. 184]|uniref:MFS transporter n=1 Tax=Streptomyces sp. 184 TaxID=1827526 RepID=UPI00389122DB